MRRSLLLRKNNSSTCMRKKIQLNIGCGIRLCSGFINVDKFFTLKDLKEGAKTKAGPYGRAEIEKGAEFVQADMCQLPFKDNYADYVECNQAIEHLPYAQVTVALKEMRRVLKPKKLLVVTTLNFDDLVRRWHENVASLEWSETVLKHYTDLAASFYGNQLGPGEFHHTPFNPPFLKLVLVHAGFTPEQIEIKGFPLGYTGTLPFRAARQIKPGLEMLRDECMFAFATK